MGQSRRIASALVFVCFLGALALRPLLQNPGVAAALDGGLDSGLWLWAPLLLVTAGLVLLRIRAVLRADTDPDDARAGVEGNHWTVESRADQASPEGRRVSARADDETTQTAGPDSHADDTTDPAARFFGGQGGARDRDFDIETEKPDAALRDHLDHLRKELDDREAATELRTLEEVVEEFEGEQTVPDYCPNEYCDARWEARTITGTNTGRYELLDDGSKVLCLNCEETFRLESGE
jgi:hypothetical protein